MSALGVMLAWSALQVTLVLLAASALHGLAARRSPASGAWVAALGLALAVVIGLVSLLPRGRTPGPREAIAAARVSPTPAGPMARLRERLTPGHPSPDERPRLTLARLRAAWERLDRTAAEPAARCRPWGTLLGVAGLMGVGAGLLGLLAGLWAVHLVRCRGRPVDDPDLNHLLAELRAAMGCRRPVEVRETPELTTPATAGCRRAVILLPEDWRSWDGDERRAVLAHELAHIIHHDYLTGVMARAALALHFYHPLVHWLAARLRLEQELAADALGARFAGGRTRYLQSLSRLALRQEGRLPYGPARAFLPARGTLIRRIAMLRGEPKAAERPWSRPRRALAALLLLAVAGGASLLHGPAVADDGDAGSKARNGAPLHPRSERTPVAPFDLSYVTDDEAQGFVAVRPAAVFRRSGMRVYQTMVNLLIGQQWAKAANALKFDPTKPGQRPLRIEMVEEVTTLVRLWRTNGKKPNGRLAFGDVFAVRTTEPVDWVTLFRAFAQDPVEAHDGDRVYYKLKKPMWGPDGAFFCPDDRTIVFAGETRLLKLLRRATPPPAPVFAQGKDWDRFLRGLLIVALDNRGGRVAKVVKEDEPGARDFDPTPLFEHADLWAFGIDDEDAIVFRGVGTCPDRAASEATARALGRFLDWARKQIDSDEPKTTPPRPGDDTADDVARAFVESVQVVRDGRSVLLRSDGLGTLAEIAARVAADLKH